MFCFNLDKLSVKHIEICYRHLLLWLCTIAVINAYVLDKWAGSENY